jgi:bacterioferritin-associated ferredoxin
MAVDRCVCFNKTFAELKRLREQSGGGFAELQAATRCGSNCGLCVPYIKLMLVTGRVTFGVSEVVAESGGGGSHATS